MDIAMRPPVVGDVPVYSAAVFLALRTSKATHITEVVIDPHDRRTIRNLQSRVENRQHLLVRHEKLRRALRKHGALRGENIFKYSLLVRSRFAVLHLSVVDSAHPDREHYIVSFATPHTLAPIVLDKIAVARPAPFLPVFLGKVAVIAEHRLAMARPDRNPVSVGKLEVLLARREFIPAFVHRGPNEIEPAPLHK